MEIAGIIFSNLHDKSIPELTAVRTMAAIPFGCKYRLVDFAVSNMVNSGIKNINIVAHRNYHSLMEHIGSGKAWGISGKRGGIRILPPYMSAHANFVSGLYTSRLEALISIYDTINSLEEKYIVMCDCDMVCNVDMKKIVDYHIEKDADVTVVTSKKVPSDRFSVSFDRSGRITEVFNTREGNTHQDYGANIWVFSKNYLQLVIGESVSNSYSSFTDDVMRRSVKTRKMFVYPISEDIFAVDSLASYYELSMRLAYDVELRTMLFGNAESPIKTPPCDLSPSGYGKNSRVKSSLVAEGCVINGTVENSIVFSGVTVGEGAKVNNSILFKDTFVGRDSSLDCVMTDRGVVVREGKGLCGCRALPFFISVGKVI